MGGTNPSLLEALASTKLNLLLDVDFNREVGKNGAVYWTKELNSLSSLIERVDRFDSKVIVDLDQKSLHRVQDEYSWEKICAEYERVFISESEV